MKVQYTVDICARSCFSEYYSVWIYSRIRMFDVTLDTEDLNLSDLFARIPLYILLIALRAI